MAVSMSVSFRQNSQSIANNTSSVTLTVKVTTTEDSHNLVGAPLRVTFGGNASGTYNTTVTFGKHTTKTIYTRTFTVSHDSDGTAKVTATVRLQTNISAGTITKTASKTLTTIPRASTPTLSGTLALGNTLTIRTNRKSTAFTHTLKWSWAGHSGIIAEDVGASTTWTPDTETMAPWLTDAASATLTITCNTYSGSTLIGTKTKTYTLSIPSTIVPTIATPTASDASGYLQVYGAFVQSKSSVNVTASATGAYGSTITGYAATVSGKTVKATGGGEKTLAIGAIEEQGTLAVKVTATDSRGRTASAEIQITVASYAAPSIDASAFRVNQQTGEEYDESDVIRVSASGAVHDVNGKGINASTVEISSKLSTAEEWDEEAELAQGQTFSVTKDLTGKSNANRYDIMVTVTDSFGSTATILLEIMTAQPIMDFRAGGDGVAVLGIADRAGFRVATDSSLGGDVYIEDEDGAGQLFIARQANGRATVKNHTALENAVWLQAMLSTGAASNILRMAEDDSVELQWTKNGLRGRVYKQIWSGSYSIGSTAKLTVPELPYYNIIALKFSGRDARTLCIRNGSNSSWMAFLGIAAYTSDSAMTLYSANVILDSETVIREILHRNRVNLGDAGTTGTITSIEGIL